MGAVDHIPKVGYNPAHQFGVIWDRADKNSISSQPIRHPWDGFPRSFQMLKKVKCNDDIVSGGSIGKSSIFATRIRSPKWCFTESIAYCEISMPSTEK